MNNRIEPNSFKHALAKFTTGVTIISTTHQDQYYGFTANSFTSVSLSPPLVSFCHSKDAGSLEAFSKTDVFGVSILSNDQADISKHFATKMDGKFAGIDYHISDITNVPLIDGAICLLQCRKTNVFEAGDHFIFIGEVIDIFVNDNKEPIVYYNKQYKTIL